MSNRTLVRSLTSAASTLTGAATLCSGALLVVSCNGRLAVLEPPVTEGTAGSGGSSGEVVTPGGSGSNDPDTQTGQSPCTCGSSDALLPLGCGTDTYGAPALSDDGETIAFNSCNTASVCAPHVWRRGEGLRAVPDMQGYSVAGLTPDGSLALLAPTDGAEAEAALYHVATGQIDSIPALPAWSNLALKADGSVFGLTADAGTSGQLARWSPSAGVELLGATGGGLQMALVAARDADVVVGRELTLGGLFRWTPAGGLELSPADLPRVAPGSPLVLSQDGSALAAYVPAELPDVRVVHWRGGTVTNLGTSERSSMAELLLSADGTVLAGSYHSGGPTNCGQNPLVCDECMRGDRWSEVAEPDFLARNVAVPHLISVMSRDGSRMVGKFGSELSLHTWSKDRGPRDLLGDLQAAGVDLSGWELDPPSAMSADGSIVTGYGRCGSGTAVYRLTLSD